MEYIVKLGAAFCLAVILSALAYGMSKIGKSAMDAISRQPEAAEKIQATMAIPLAFMEGAALFAIVVCLIMVVT